MEIIDIIPIILLFGIMYFFLIRPQLQEKAAHDKLVESLAKDDRIVTSSGLHGKIVAVEDATIRLEIAEKTRITVDKKAIARRAADKAKA